MHTSPIGFGICLALLSSFFHHLSATITNPSRSSSSHCLCAVFLSVDQGLAMDSRSADIFLPGNGLNSENNHSLTDSEHYPEFANGFDSFGSAFASSEDDAFNHASVLSIDDLAGDLEFSSVPDGGSFHPDFDLRLTVSVGDESPNHSDDSNSSDPVLKYISQMLMEENMEDESWVFPSDFALQDTEKSFSDVLEEQPDVFRQQTPEFDVSQLIESPPSSIFSENSSFQNTVGTTFNANSNSSNSTDAHWLHDRGKNDHTSPQDVIHLNEVSQLSSDSNSQIYSKAISNSFSHHGDGVMDSATLIKNMFSDAASVLQFNKGMEEARKFLPDSSSLLKNFGNISNSESKMGNLKVSDSIVKNEGEELLGGGSRGRKNHERVEELDVGEGRASKQSASNADEAEFAEWFDKVLLMKGTGGSQCFSDGCQESAAANKPQPSGSSVGRGRSRRQGNNSSVDLRSLLVLCAQAVSTYDLRTANELLKQIRQNSSPNGDGSQRLAHYFANGLEARLAGSQSGAQNFFASIASKKVSIAKMLRAYQLHLCCCPFKKFGIIYANYLIYKLAEKAKVLHIIDFGIGFGFQWPILIQKLGERHKEGHLPLVKLRITGIEFPQPGFRPTERIEETARRLASYCERFNVPFEYKVIPSRNWETVRVEDLKVERNEMVAVNAFGRFNNLLDDTVEGDSPRDAVLSLIRSIKPDVFLHFISNGSYNAPFFVTRFKEALFHLSSMYDMLDATIQDPSKDESRLVLEGDFYGREIMNVVSCEGAERVERPETYKQWQARHVRAGFKQLPLCEEIMEKLRWKLKEYYHKDFVVDEDGKWMLLGWKGRIMYGMSCWVPV